jgi:DNA-binding MarR family transcriptional regulator
LVETAMSDSLLNPSHCVSANLHKTARAVSRVYAEEMRPAGLARSQFAILETLEHHGPMAVSDMARRLYMERTTLTRNLTPLVDAGLITRRAADRDARVKEIAIAPAGRRKLKQARGLWRRAQARMLKLFGENEWRELEATLRGLRRIVR